MAVHDDATNNSEDYLRNRLRHRMANMSEDDKRQLLGLWSEQKALKKEIDEEVRRLIGDGPDYSRYFFTHVNEASAIECLRQATWALLTRPQLQKVLYAVKTAKPHKIYLAGAGVRLKFTSRNFTVELIK